MEVNDENTIKSREGKNMFYPGMRIKELRIKKGLSQDDLANKLRMHRVNISHYERGKITNIPSDTLIEIAKILNTDIDYLLGLSNIQEEDLDENFRSIQRAAKIMSPEQRKKMVRLIKIVFDDVLDEEDN